MTNRSALGSSIAKLGFGLMRLPMKENEVDLDQTKNMVDHFMSKGFTYFDTAYVYGNGISEKTAYQALVSRYPRSSFQLANKLPSWELNCKEDMQRIFDISLERTGVTYFDFYLLHNVGSDRIAKYDNLGAWKFLKQLKEKGLAKHIGFSFHDSAEKLDELLQEHPEAEFVQLQLNYGDWENAIIQSRLCYEAARRHNKPIVVMEPVKGGSLVSLPPEAQALLKNANPHASLASWAIRFAASLEGVITVLSGMSTLEQVLDNTNYMSNFHPLSEDEHAVLRRVRKIIETIPTVPCTACGYCLDGCPQNIPIPSILKLYNNYAIYKHLPETQRSYRWETRAGNKASTCIQCGACETSCPQYIDIMDALKEIAYHVER